MKKTAKDIRDLPGLKFLTLSFFVYLYAPLVILVVFSFNATRSATIWGGFSTDWYLKALGNDDIQRAAMNSLIIATIAAVLATTIATMAALALARNKRIKKGHAAFNGALMLPLMIPEIVTAVATLTFFSAIGLSLGIGNIIIAHTVFCIPFAYLPIRARLQGMDESYEMAARDLYANQWVTLRHITLPLISPGIVAGAMLAFIISVDDFIITLMVAGAGSTTLPIYIYSLVRVGITPEVNAVSSILLALSVVIVTLSYLVGRGR